ncbi:ABC transporter ATP-binding protein [Clostridium sp.]|uniref:ABC transporter ATP-binding protein n=1 Tax=Clostridium sp. TaxID=1506 RepID=UPI003217E8F5
MKDRLVSKSIEKVIKNNIGFCIILVLVIIGVVILSLVPPQLLKVIIDKYLINKVTTGLLSIAIIYLLVLIFIGILDVIKEAFLVVLGQKITKEIRKEMMYKLEKVNSMYFSNNDSGEVVSLFTNDVDTINSLFTNGIIGMIIDCFKIIGILTSIWIFSFYLGIVTLILIPIIYLITRGFQKLMLKAQFRNRVLVGKVNNHISESLKNITMIKTYSKEKYMEDKYVEYLKDNFETVEKINYFDSVYSPIIQLIRAAVISIIVILSSSQFNYIGISLGMVAASIDLISNLFSPIENLGMEFQDIQRAISGIKRVNEFYEEREEEDKNRKLKKETLISNPKHVTIGFNNVSFSYTKGVRVLEEISFDIVAGEKITVVGRTGVGKSTLFKLILGLIKPTKGSITINEVDVYSIPNKEKRKIFGYVSQGFTFIEGSVKDQVTLQDKNISQENVEVVMKLVGLHDYVLTLEKGYETMIEHDKLFSQGQKQLLAIARAIVMNPPILLLDEITANLDSVTEEKVVSVLQNISTSRTILSISHRLSSIIACDKIVRIENGRVKNIGTPEEMLQKDNWYRSHMELEKLTWN